MNGTWEIRAQRVLLPDGSQQPATIRINQSTGKIVEVVTGRSGGDASVDCLHVGADCVVMPGLVDAHVHLNDPGRQSWETFATGTRAALKGGVTTVVDMPLNSIPPTTTVENLRAKQAAAKGNTFVNVGFYGGVIPGNAEHLSALVDNGVRGFKCFMIDSGVEEFPCVSESEIRTAMRALLPHHQRTFLMFHAELPQQQHSDDCGDDPSRYDTFLHSRPQSMENEAIAMVIRLCREFRSLPCHIVHLSSAEAIPAIQQAKQEGLPLSVETCFHYLTLSAEEVPRGATQFKCCPPIRDQRNRDLLWKGLQDGIIDYVVSDHSPSETALKCFDTGNFMAAWGGISSLQLGLPVFWTEASKRGIELADLSRWLSTNPAKRVGLGDRKGRIAVGYDADLIIFDPEAEFKVEPSDLRYKVKISPYIGRNLRGCVRNVILNGRLAGDDSSAEPTGVFLL